MKWKDKINKNYLQICIYVIFTASVIYTLSLLAKNAPIIFKGLMDKVQWLIGVVKPVIFGFVFAYLMDPMTSFFEEKFVHLQKRKLFRRLKAPRTLGAVISVLLLFIVIIGLISLLVFSVTDQLRLANFDDIVNLIELYKNSINSMYTFLINKLGELDIQFDELEKYIKSATGFFFRSLENVAESTLTSFQNISGYLTTIIFSLIIGFYFLIDGRMFISYLKKVFMALFSDKMNQRVSKIMQDLDTVFSGYIRGQLTDAIVMMILISFVLSVIGVKFAIVIGIFAGIGNLIPYFGPIIAYFSTTIVCLIYGDIRTLVISLIALFVIQFIDGNFIGPRLLSHSIKIHPLLVIIFLIFGSAVGGLLGMLLAVPVGAYIKLVFVRFIEHRLVLKKGVHERGYSSEYREKH